MRDRLDEPLIIVERAEAGAKGQCEAKAKLWQKETGDGGKSVPETSAGKKHRSETEVSQSAGSETGDAGTGRENEEWSEEDSKGAASGG